MAQQNTPHNGYTFRSLKRVPSVSEYIKNNYDNLEQISTSLLGQVIVARHKSSGIKHCIKKCFKDLQQQLSQKVHENPKMEVEVMEQLNYNNNESKYIVKLIESLEDDSTHVTILEYLSDGDMCTFLQSKERKGLSLYLAKKFSLELITGVKYIHSKGYCHLDLSLENLLLDLKNELIKICDFGLSRKIIFDFNNNIRKYPISYIKPGKKGYISPEINSFESFYGENADVFSIGVIIWIFLTGFPPFESASSKDPCWRYFNAGYIDLLVEQWKLTDKIPPNARDILKRIFTKSQDRISLNEMLEHPFLKDVILDANMTQNDNDNDNEQQIEHMNDHSESKNDDNTDNSDDYSTLQNLQTIDNSTLQVAVTSLSEEETDTDLVTPIPKSEQVNDNDVMTIATKPLTLKSKISKTKKSRKRRSSLMSFCDYESFDSHDSRLLSQKLERRHARSYSFSFNRPNFSPLLALVPQDSITALSSADDSIACVENRKKEMKEELYNENNNINDIYLGTIANKCKSDENYDKHSYLKNNNYEKKEKYDEKVEYIPSRIESNKNDNKFYHMSYNSKDGNERNDFCREFDDSDGELSMDTTFRSFSSHIPNKKNIEKISIDRLNKNCIGNKTKKLKSRQLKTRKKKDRNNKNKNINKKDGQYFLRYSEERDISCDDTRKIRAMSAVTLVNSKHYQKFDGKNKNNNNNNNNNNIDDNNHFNKNNSISDLESVTILTQNENNDIDNKNENKLLSLILESEIDCVIEMKNDENKNKNENNKNDKNFIQEKKQCKHNPTDSQSSEKSTKSNDSTKSQDGRLVLNQEKFAPDTPKSMMICNDKSYTFA